MSDKRWKQMERRGARLFGTRRNPLSGIGSGHDTHSDSLHPRLYLEGKSTSNQVKRRTWMHKLWDLFIDSRDKAKQEGKIPILHLHMKSQRGFLIVINSADMPGAVKEYLMARGIGLHCTLGEYPTEDE